MDLLDMINSRRFLGAEFLMWLWFKADCFDGLMEVKDHGSVEIIFDDALTLEAYMAETQRQDLKGGTPAFTPEAKTGLRHGKRASKAKMRFVKEGREWVFTLKAENLDISSAKMPTVLSREDDERFYERMYLLEELESILERLFEEFLRIRLAKPWDDKMLPAMQAWIQSDELAKPDDYPTL
jgi:hypothetical protein